MRNVRNKANGVIISRVRKGIMSWLLVNAAVLALLATNQAVQQTCTPPPPNMTSWWPGDGNANDIQDGNHGTLLNGAAFAPGMVGQAFSFDGVDDFVEVPNSPSLNPTNQITVDAWYKPVSFSGSARTRFLIRGTLLIQIPTINTA